MTYFFRYEPDGVHNMSIFIIRIVFVAVLLFAYTQIYEGRTATISLQIIRNHACGILLLEEGKVDAILCMAWFTWCNHCILIPGSITILMATYNQCYLYWQSYVIGVICSHHFMQRGN